MNGFSFVTVRAKSSKAALLVSVKRRKGARNIGAAHEGAKDLHVVEEQKKNSQVSIMIISSSPTNLDGQ